jgi:hypothetical protein
MKQLLILFLFLTSFAFAQDGVLKTLTAGGSANTYTISEALPATYDKKERYQVIFPYDNTGASTLARAGQAAKSMRTSKGDVLAIGDIKAGNPYLISYSLANGYYVCETCGSADMVLASVQTNIGVKTFLDGTLKLRNVGNTFNGSFANTNTADRTYTLPDFSGNVLVTNGTTDITSELTILSTNGSPILISTDDDAGQGQMILRTGLNMYLDAKGDFYLQKNGTSLIYTDYSGNLNISAGSSGIVSATDFWLGGVSEFRGSGFAPTRIGLTDGNDFTFDLSSGAGNLKINLQLNATGDMYQRNASGHFSRLAAVATGNALISGGVGTVNSWGKIGLSTHVSGTLPIANGGTGQTTANAAVNALLPSQTGNSGKVLQTDGTNTSWQNPGSFSYSAKTSLYTLTANDYTIEVTSGTHTQTLPTAVGISGRIYCITNSGSGVVTVATTSSQTFVNISGTPTIRTLNQYNGGCWQSNNVGWLKLNEF